MFASLLHFAGLLVEDSLGLEDALQLLAAAVIWVRFEPQASVSVGPCHRKTFRPVTFNPVVLRLG